MEWLLIGIGIFALCGAIMDWDWFMNHRKARFFVQIFGRTGARIFYGLLGTAIIIAGGLMVAGIIRDT